MKRNKKKTSCPAVSWGSSEAQGGRETGLSLVGPPHPQLLEAQKQEKTGKGNRPG